MRIHSDLKYGDNQGHFIINRDIQRYSDPEYTFLQSTHTDFIVYSERILLYLPHLNRTSAETERFWQNTQICAFFEFLCLDIEIIHVIPHISPT